MSKRSKKSRSSRSGIGRVGLITAALLVVVALSATVWLAVDTFSGSASSDSVKLKKSEITTTTKSSQSAQTEDTSSTQSTTTTPQTTTTVQTTVAKKVAQVKISSEAAVSDSAITLKWEPADQAEGYYVYRTTGKAWEIVSTITNANECSFADSSVEPGEQYAYKIVAFANGGDSIVTGKDSATVKVMFPGKIERPNLYLLPKGTQFFNDNLAVNYSLGEEGYFTGLPDETHEGYIRVDCFFETRLVKASVAKQVKGAVALHTGAIGQESGQIYGRSACGPTAAAIITNYDKGEKWNKDDLIRYTEKNKLADQGSMMGKVGQGGMSAPYVIKLIESYSNGKYTAKNLYNDKEKTSVQLKRVIDGGKHCVLSVRYSWGIVHHPYSIIHFVEPGAYSVEDGKLYFYYVDTSYSTSAPVGLHKVAATEIDESVVTVNSEPKCIIVLDGPVTTAADIKAQQTQPAQAAQAAQPQQEQPAQPQQEQQQTLQVKDEPAA